MCIRKTVQRAQRARLASAVAISAAFLMGPVAVAGEITFSLTIVDDDRAATEYYDDIESNLMAAAADWAARLVGDASLEIIVIISDSVPLATGRSMTSSWVYAVDGVDVYEEGAAAEINTGTDPNGEEPDIEIVMNPKYVSDNLWFDPSPARRDEEVPRNRTDAVSVFLHELGHAFCFNGWRDGITGELPGDYMSRFDELVSADSGYLYIEGAAATAEYCESIGVTYGNYAHVANWAPGPSADLIMDLMNGLVFYYSTRYRLSELDWAVAEDTGLTVAPNPCSGDLNGDGVVDGSDLAIVLGGWSTSSAVADINGDCTVDGPDLAIVLGGWGDCDSGGVAADSQGRPVAPAMRTGPRPAARPVPEPFQSLHH